jgi:hypothetical protein
MARDVGELDAVARRDRLEADSQPVGAWRDRRKAIGGHHVRAAQLQQMPDRKWLHDSIRSEHGSPPENEKRPRRGLVTAAGASAPIQVVPSV